jgi:hypothetical protein
VEGMYLNIKHAATPGRYRMEMQWDLDNKGEFRGDPIMAAIASLAAPHFLQ